jgi:hypothetical protein
MKLLKKYSAILPQLVPKNFRFSFPNLIFIYIIVIYNIKRDNSE